MRTRRTLLRVPPIVLTVAASSFAIGCGSARSTGGDPHESASGSGVDVIHDAPALEAGERLARLADGSCEIHLPSGQTRPLEGCPARVRPGTTLVRRYDGQCFFDYDCPSTREAVCNPPEPDRTDCPPGSPPVVLSRNPPAPVSR